MGIFKFSLIFSVIKFFDKGFGIFRNYIIGNYTSSDFSDSFYLIMSLAEVFGNSAVKSAEFNSAKPVKVNNNNSLFLLLISFFCVGVFFFASLKIEYATVLVAITGYILFRATSSYIKFSISLRIGGYVEVIFSVISTVVLSVYILYGLNDESFLFFLMTIVGLLILFLIFPKIMISSVKNITSKVLLNRQFFMLLILGGVPFLEKYLYQQLGEGVLTNFVISYMLVSIPLVLLPVSTMAVIFSNFNVIKKWLVIPIQISAVLIVSGIVFYINESFDFFPQFDGNAYLIGIIACLGNIIISYIESQCFINNSSTISVLVRKYISLGAVCIFFYVGAITSEIGLVSMIVFMNLATLIPLLIMRQG